MVICPICNSVARKAFMKWDNFDGDKIATVVCNNCNRILHFEMIDEEPVVVEVQKQEWEDVKEIEELLGIFDENIPN